MTEAIKNEVRQRTIFLLQKRDEANEEEERLYGNKKFMLDDYAT